MNVKIAAKEFRAIRERRFMTQREFGEALGASPSNVQRIELSPGIAKLRPRLFRKLAELEGTTPEDLFARIGIGIGPRTVNR